MNSLDNSLISIVVALRLSALICTLHDGICANTVDETGTNGLSCHKSAARLSRHSAVNDFVKRSLS